MNLERSWSDISLSDIESSTSGSDSSLSDSLPIHLLNIVDDGRTSSYSTKTVYLLQKFGEFQIFSNEK